MTESTLSTNPICSWGATQIAAAIAAGEVTSFEVTTAFVERIREVHDCLNALVVPRLDEAIEEARQRDEQRARGELLGPLHGVPFTIKECFHLQGTPATMGLGAFRERLSSDDGILVQRLRTAGGICLGKTNVPQLMMWHECDNPVYGRTQNPWDLRRTCGGSTGGEAALIAAGGSPLGLGNDLGGSIRIPAHFCGIHGLKPTSGLLTRQGTVHNFRGLTAMQTQPGPLARSVDDLELALQILHSGPPFQNRLDTSPVTLTASHSVELSSSAVGYWCEDGYFPASPAIRRVVTDSATALQAQGITTRQVQPPFLAELVEGYLGLMAADGASDARLLARGSSRDWRIDRMLLLQGLSSFPRMLVVAAMRLAGQPALAKLVGLARPLSASKERQLAWRMSQLKEQFLHWMAENRLAALICPPYALPATPHRLAIDLVAAASYAFFVNVLGFPSGVVSLSRVRPEEENERQDHRDLAYRRAYQTDQGSSGLPVGVQVIAPPWQEHVVLHLQRRLEQAFQTQPDFPSRCVVPSNVTPRQEANR